MKVLFLTGREVSYQRNDVLLRAFQRFSQVDVLSARSRPRSLLFNSLKIATKFFTRLTSSKYDVIFTGFYGHLLMLPVGVAAKAPVIFDAFLSTYDTLIEDRKVAAPGSLMARASIWLDRTSCQIADAVFLDTQRQVDYFSDRFGLKLKRIRPIPVGCNEDIFFPRTTKNRRDKITVLYYSSYLPLHGVDVVIRAAEKLADVPVHFRLVGSGQTLNPSISLAKRLRIQNVEFIHPLPIEGIADEIARSDICLGGHFGPSDKAGRVIPGKVYQILAMKKPVVASSTPANLELLSNNETALLCPQGDPDRLAEAILALTKDNQLREWIAQRGYSLYRERCSEGVITTMVKETVSELIR